MISQNNVTHMLVGKDLNLLANTGTRADLAVGQLGVFLVGSKTALGTGGTDLAAGDRFTIATKNSKGVIVETPVIEYSNIMSKSITPYAAGTQRSRAIGFNGTSGTIEVVDNGTYTAHIFFKDNSSTFGQGVPVKFGVYGASSNATQAEIASGLALNINKNAKKEKPAIIKAEVLVNDGGLATSGGVLTLVNGSKFVGIVESAGGALDAGKYNADGATIAAGDYLRIGTAVTDPCYLVTAVTGGGTAAATLTLGQPYLGVSNASLAAAGAEVIAAATAATAGAGVKLTANALTDAFEPGLVRYDFTEFDVQIGGDFGATPQTSLTTPSLGAGTYWGVAQNEWFLKGNRGEAWRVGNYPKTITLEATSGKTYNQITFSYATTNAKTIDRTVASFGTVMIATEVPGTGAVYAQLGDVLNIAGL